MLHSTYQDIFIEAGCDEAGRGCLAGPVYAAAVVFAKDFRHELLTDSKQLPASQRYALRTVIQETALAYAVASVSAAEIDRINIHNASYMAMHKALDALKIKAEYILVDGNRFIPYRQTPHCCIIKGDGKFLSIAAASILAKTYRDDYMAQLSEEFPQYGWTRNKGYPTVQHRIAILEHGITPHHRRTFRVKDTQLSLF